MKIYYRDRDQKMNLFLSGSGVTTVTQEWMEWQCIDKLTVHWMISNLFDAKNLAKIEASDWSRAQNPGF